MKREINVTQYQEGIFDVCDFLVTDLIKFLKEEGRFKYKMIDYINNIQNEFKSAHELQTKEDINIYGRVLYIINRAISKDYLRLRQKKLTPADSLICIILKLFNVSETLEGDNRFKKEQENIKSILQKLYDNIRNRGKLDHLWKIENSIRDAVDIKKYGTLSLDEFDIYKIEHPIENLEPDMTGEKNTWIDEKTKGKEINF